jgi:hypothetical protein
MIRMYFKLRYNEDAEAFEMYDPHTNHVIASGEQLAYLKVKNKDLWEYHPLTEEDLIEIVDKSLIVYAEYNKAKETFEFMSNKIAINWAQEEYLKSVITSRYKS